MIKRLVNKILKSINNLPAQYKVALARILTGIMESIMALEEKKVDKEEGKDLSTNDFTDELKEKLNNIEDGAQKNVKSDWNATEGDALILNKPSFDEYPNTAEWDHINHKIIFKHNGTELPDMEVDGADFVKDGMIENIEIVDDNLVITFNTDHGHEPISIPLSEIFNPENYYTKEDINNRIYTKEQSNNKFVEKVTGKQLSTEDFTTELKEKLESIISSNSLVLYYKCYSTGNNYSVEPGYSMIVENSKRIKSFIDGGGNPENIIAIINFTVKLSDIGNYDTKPYPNNWCIGYGYRKSKLNNRTIEQFSIIGGGVIYKNLGYKQGAFTGAFTIEYFSNGTVIEDAYVYNYSQNELITRNDVVTLLGQITSYTNEQIEQLIAEGNQVEIFKLNITEDKTLLQQILTDNPEDGNVDITSIMYFVYDSTKQKYYDVNSIIIETVESDRQINIVAANDRYDYTAVKINTDEAAYIINPSHVESANADWNENDEDKASYVKNRTHWIDDNNVVHPLDSKYLEDLTDEEINQILE